MTDGFLGIGYGSCRHCDEQLDVHELAKDGVCKNVQCQRKETIRAANEKLARKEAELQDAVTELLTALKREIDCEKIATLITPSNNQELTTLPATRRLAFGDHLKLIIEQQAEAVIQGSQTTDKLLQSCELPVDPDLILQQACANCRGHCCQQGNTGYAFINATTLDRCLESGLAKDNAELFKKYMSLIPEVGYEESCVYHSDIGCALPRELRSDVCNNYLCERLHNRRVKELSGSKNILLVAQTNFEIKRWEKGEGGADY